MNRRISEKLLKTRSNILAAFLVAASAINGVSFVQTANRVAAHIEPVDFPQTTADRVLYVPAEVFRGVIFSAITHVDTVFNTPDACGSSRQYRDIVGYFEQNTGKLGSTAFKTFYATVGLPGAYAGGLYIASLHIIATIARHALSSPTSKVTSCSLNYS